MEWHQIRIFVPNQPPYDGAWWAETLLGRVIKPLIEERKPTGFWFSHYEQPAEGQDWGDCDKCKILEHRDLLERDGLFRSLRFRVALDVEQAGAFEEALTERLEQEHCVVSGWCPDGYDPVFDLGEDRYLSEPRSTSRRQQRSARVLELVQAVSRLKLDALVEDENAPGERFRPETIDTPIDALGEGSSSSFLTPHHLFCNITCVDELCTLLVPGDPHRIYVLVGPVGEVPVAGFGHSR